MTNWVNRNSDDFKSFVTLVIRVQEVIAHLDDEGVKANLKLFNEQVAHIKELEDSETSPEFKAKGVNSVEVKQNAREFLKAAISQLSDLQDPKYAQPLLALRNLDADMAKSIEQSKARSGQADSAALSK